MYGECSIRYVILRFDKRSRFFIIFNGEWNIIEVNGSAIVPAENQELPFIGFDTATGKVYGNSGCNRMMGSIDLNSKPGTIDMSRLGSTRMACPDMTTEQNVLNALGQVKSYKKTG